MKLILLMILIVVPIKTSCQDKGASSKPFLEIYTDSLFQAGVDSAHIAGGAILVFKEGKMLLDKSYGYASLELSTPMPEDGIFEIGSVTKQFTAAAIFKLAEAKRLSLEDDLRDHIPFDTKGRKITINNLLNHTSGIRNYTDIPEFWSLSMEEHPRDTLVQIIEQNDLTFEPNDAFLYNNSAYFILGLIIEEVTGQSYEEYLKQEFFDPLGMNSTLYCPTRKVIDNKVYGYNYSPEGLEQKAYLNHTWPYSAASLCSTIEDLLLWMKALHTGKVLTEPMYSKMIRPGKLNDGTPVRYAQGLVNFSNFGHKEIGHVGAIHGFLSDTRYFPEEDLYIICLVNTTGPFGATYFADKITWKLLDKKEYIAAQLDINPSNIQGTYTGTVRGAKNIIKIGATENGITRHYIDDDSIDTLKVYIGNNTWMIGNDQIIIKDGIYREDNVYNHYVFKKDSLKEKD